MIYAVYGRWEKGSALQSGDLEQVSATFRPDAQGVCVWTEPEEPSVLRVSVDVEATSYEEAILLGRAALVEAANSASLPGRPTEVLVMTDQGQAAWRP